MSSVLPNRLVRQPLQREMLLHSMANFHSVIEPLVRLMQPRTLCEVGVERKLFGELLQRWADSCNSRYIAVDPSVEGAIQETSVDYLRRAPLHDMYFMDGDHNYATVAEECLLLNQVWQDSPNATLVFWHDVGWPCSYRDMYYAPERLPAEKVHQHTFDLGVRPDTGAPVAGGFESCGNFAWAIAEGGPANGVRAAVDDFAREHPAWQTLYIPGVFGLCVMYPTSGLTPEVYAALDGLRNAVEKLGPFIAELEYNRLELFLEVLRLGSEVQRASAERDCSFSTRLLRRLKRCLLTKGGGAR